METDFVTFDYSIVKPISKSPLVRCWKNRSTDEMVSGFSNSMVPVKFLSYGDTGAQLPHCMPIIQPCAATSLENDEQSGDIMERLFRIINS